MRKNLPLIIATATVAIVLGLIATAVYIGLGHTSTTTPVAATTTTRSAVATPVVDTQRADFLAKVRIHGGKPARWADNDPDKLIRYSAGNGDISGVHDTMRTLEVSQSDAQFLNRTYQQV